MLHMLAPPAEHKSPHNQIASNPAATAHAKRKGACTKPRKAAVTPQPKHVCKAIVAAITRFAATDCMRAST